MPPALFQRTLITAILVICGAAGSQDRAVTTQDPELGTPTIEIHSLLRDPKVQRELELDREQIQPVLGLVQDISAHYASAFQSVRGLEGDSREKKLREKLQPAEREWKTRLAKILRPAQVRRFRQIDLQMRNLFTCQEPEIRSALGLSEEQCELIDDIIKQSKSDQVKKLEAKDKLLPGELDHMRAITLKKIERTLNDKQKATWHSLLGSPFHL